MDSNVPYMLSVKNVPAMLAAAQKAAVPESFGHEFLKDLGFTSSNDRAFIKVLKYLGMLDASGKPQASYREFVDQTRSKAVLASRLRHAYDDLYNANPDAHKKTSDQLKGWFKTKTGAGDAVAIKMASTLKAFASWADFSSALADEKPAVEDKAKREEQERREKEDKKDKADKQPRRVNSEIGLVYRLEIHLPDTQNVDTFRAIFKAMREELDI
ncbi:MAG: hypothetical protein DLM73_07925 [Chthoniobacterales bacterium]|nr:MAG: hypothetical protein DLM73_07925 [Chthoniobacterales bacterium]